MPFSPPADADKLPHQRDDAVLRLYIHYFLTADLMREQLRKLDLQKRAKGRLSVNKELERYRYWLIWLSGLYVVVDGFLKKIAKLDLIRQRPEIFSDLRPLVADLTDQCNAHRDSLRRFRNATFHFEEHSDEQIQFVLTSENREDWALDLHRKFADFFSRYRVHCGVIYMMANRMDEDPDRPNKEPFDLDIVRRAGRRRQPAA